MILKDLLLLPVDVLELIDTVLTQMFIWDIEDIKAKRKERFFPDEFRQDVRAIRKTDPESKSELTVSDAFVHWFSETLIDLCSSTAWSERSREISRLNDIRLTLNL